MKLPHATTVAIVVAILVSLVMWPLVRDDLEFALSPAGARLTCPPILDLPSGRHANGVSVMRVVRAVYGKPGVDLLATVHGRAHGPTLAAGAMGILNLQFPHLHLSAPEDIEKFLPKLHAEPILVSATFGGANKSVDVRWRLAEMVFDGVLRIPTDYPLATLFGNSFWPEGSKLTVEANVGSDVQRASIPVTNGFLSKELYVGAPVLSPDIKFDNNLYETNVINKLVRGKVGIEIGGPSGPSYGPVYKACASFDLVNFAAKTMWGDISDGGEHTQGGSHGKTFIRDGSTLEGIPDNKYDFALGSHYLEHLLNPLKALHTMRRVLKPSGAVILVLPRKEFCFDDKRNQGSVEDMVYRFVNDVDETDMRFAHLDQVTLQSNLARDLPAKNYEYFLGRSLMNVDMRGIHQFVYDLDSLTKILELMGFTVVFKGAENLNQYIAATKN